MLELGWSRGARAIATCAVASLAFAGCKSANNGSTGQCGLANACGGDVEGTWNITSVCVENAAALAGMAVADRPECASLFKDTQVHADGTMAFASGTATTAYTLTVDLHAAFTRECLGALGSVSASAIDLQGSCERLDMEFSINSSFTGASCAIAGETCDCMISRRQTQSVTGTYTTEGSALIDDEGTRGDYCVDGSMLSIVVASEPTTVRFTLER